MELTIKVIPNAKVAKIKEENCMLKVYVSSPPEDGKANEQVIETLAKHFSVKPSQVHIQKGFTTRIKIIEIKDK
jgi:uncharacterized protein (TIGR00251 family)